MSQIRVLLIVRKCDAQHIRLSGNVMEKGAAAEFNIVRVRAEEENPFAEEVHGCLFAQHGIGAYRKRPECFYLPRRGMETESTIRQIIQPAHVLTDGNAVAKQDRMRRPCSIGRI